MKKATDTYVQPKSLIILGTPGAGKTTLVSQFPGLFLLDCDQNLGGPLQWLKANDKKPDFYYADPFHDEDGNVLPRELHFQRAATLLMEANDMPDVKTLAVDSLTTFVDIVITEVLRLQGRKLGSFDFKTKNSKSMDEPMQIQDWGAFFNVMKQFIIKLKSTGKTIIFTGHLKTREDEASKMLRQFISVPGQMAEVIAGLFSEVWLLENAIKVKNGAKVQERLVTTFPSTKGMSALGLKSSCGVESGSPVDVDDLIRKVLA